MIKAILIDDEKNSRESLRKKLQTHCAHVQVVAECANGGNGGHRTTPTPFGVFGH
jgi:YesN/AraC family two-component response regulator